jgi:hypothetical protein
MKEEKKKLLKKVATYVMNFNQNPPNNRPHFTGFLNFFHEKDMEDPTLTDEMRALMGKSFIMQGWKTFSKHGTGAPVVSGNVFEKPVDEIMDMGDKKPKYKKKIEPDPF